jgi:transposase InsO family protein
MNPVITERLVAVAQEAQRAGHGCKEAIYRNACSSLGLSRGTLMRKLKEVKVALPRKQRADAGQTALTREEAMQISGVLMESTRKNGKRLYSVAQAVTELRANGMIRAEFLDQDSGEIRPLSVSTVQRALRQYGLHPDQLLAPAPATELKSRHPNHVWQIDASLCVLYYLKPSGKYAGGLQVMDHGTFYKNKPRNLARIAADRVWSYEITDHASGWIYVEYVMGAESGENLCTVLINAMQDRGDLDMLHGVPRILMCDPGAANTAAMTKNLARALGIEMIAHMPGNARVTGQVEKARDIIERQFEAGLKFRPVANLDELNALAAKWRGKFNWEAIHSRHGKTRSAVWMTITSGQLIKAPAVDVCRELAVAAPESRKVGTKLRVSFQGHEYDVSTVPGVMVGETLMVTRNPWRDDAAQIVLVGEDGREVFHVVNEVRKDDLGFAEEAAVIGERFKRHKDTPAQTARKEIEQLVTGTDSVSAAAEVRKSRALPFGGRFDPYKRLDETETLPAFLPRRGTAHDLAAPIVELPPLSHVEAAKAIKSRIGEVWMPEHFQELRERFPQGAPNDKHVLDAFANELLDRAAARTEWKIA